MRLLIAALAAASLATPAWAETAEATETATDAADEALLVTYNGYVAGLRIVKAVVDASINSDDYATDARFTSAGIARMFKVSDIQATSNGVIEDGALTPALYEHRNHASNSNRLVQVLFEDGEVTPNINPPFGSMGEPPATAEQRFGAFDPITAILKIMREGGEEPCERSIPVFDGKQRYNLNIQTIGVDNVRTKGYRGEALRCDIYYEPIAGYDADELADPEEYDRPVAMWLIETEAGGYIPVRFRTRRSGFRISVEARRIAHEVETAN